MKKLLILVAGLITFLHTEIGHAGSWERHFQWGGDPGQFCGSSCFLLPMFLCIAFWGAVIFGIVHFIKWLIRAGKQHETVAEETALDILKKRYARGEISREDFEKMKQDIM